MSAPPTGYGKNTFTSTVASAQQQNTQLVNENVASGSQANVYYLPFSEKDSLDSADSLAVSAAGANVTQSESPSPADTVTPSSRSADVTQSESPSGSDTTTPYGKTSIQWDAPSVVIPWDSAAPWDAP